ncbi:EmrB/QacA family drug resistance transporter [Amycolatopsis sp. NBRC 101858]|uniref:MDR family MFS transporter n=1 Tax=Amycolatopsis sp. NBRC 101858 TaxID=3032200 RepID=UPI0024A43078|nr:MDR family MFS transporter [Amycolatopsis sp. NBRC 101858]GLY38904.1 EmrB/QacA family drug resistance transporter [Amycolatopsis sp. NBRC 101858]
MSATVVNEPSTGVGQPGARRQVLKALSGLLIALFVSSLSSTVVSTALPRIIGSLNGSPTQYTWVVTATLLSAAATTPIWGKLSDLFSKKTLVQAAIAVFVLGSMAAGVSQSAGQLIASRAVQGIGVGGVQALVQIAIAAMIPPRERGRYSGYLSSVTAVSTIGGPLLGGVVVDTPWLGWRWCFFVGVPVAAVALVLLQRTLRLPVIRRGDVKIDYLGATLIASGVSVLLIWVSFVGRSFAWASWPTAFMVGGALILLAVALVVETRVAEPIVPLGIIRRRTTALAIVGSLAVGTAMFGSSVFLSQYFQLSRGYAPTQAGLLTIPMMAGILISSVVAGRLISRIGKIKPFIVAGAVFLMAGFAGLSTIDRTTPLAFVGVAMLFVGFGVGMTLQNLVLAVQNTVPLKDVGAASSSVSFFRSLGGTIGVSVLGAVLARQVADQTARGSAAAPGQAAQEIVRDAYGDASGHVFLISACVAVLAVVAALLLKPVTLRASLDLADVGETAAGVVEGVPVVTPAALEPETPVRRQAT